MPLKHNQLVLKCNMTDLLRAHSKLWTFSGVNKALREMLKLEVTAEKQLHAVGTEMNPIRFSACMEMAYVLNVRSRHLFPGLVLITTPTAEQFKTHAFL